MTFIFADKKLGGRVSPKKGQAPKFRIDFDELIIRKVDNAIHCFMWAINCDAYAIEDKETKEKWSAPGKLYCKISSDADSGGEKLMHAYLNQLDEGKCYKGFMSVDGAFVGAEKALADPVQLEGIKMVFFAGEEIQPENLKPDEIEIPKGRSGGGYSRGETTQQRIDARLAFLQKLSESEELRDALFIQHSLVVGDEVEAQQKHEMLLALLA